MSAVSCAIGDLQAEIEDLKLRLEKKDEALLAMAQERDRFKTQAQHAYGAASHMKMQAEHFLQLFMHLGLEEPDAKLLGQKIKSG